MNILLGSIYPNTLLEELTRRKQFVDYPANIFQQSLVTGLDEHLPDLQVVTSPVIKSNYSTVKDLCHKKYFSHNNSESERDIYVGTFPVPGLQMIVELWRVYWTLKKLYKTKEQKNQLIVYALHSPFLLAAVLLSKSIHCTCVVVPDLPEYMSNQGSITRNISKKIDRVIINFCLKRLDCFVLLSSYMRERLPIEKKKWVLMEGIFDIQSVPKGVVKCVERVVLYCGNLSSQYGILDLVEAFSKINKENYRLWICGRGNSEYEIKKKAEKDDRIKFFGVVSHDQVLELQQQATVLINPRTSKGEYTKYSFPSKTMEYLASGTPTIMYHLPAIPKEYDEHIFYITDESIEGMKNKIEEVCEKQQKELDEFGKRASEFIKTQKNAFVQSKKVIDLMGEFA